MLAFELSADNKPDGPTPLHTRGCKEETVAFFGYGLYTVSSLNGKVSTCIYEWRDELFTDKSVLKCS